MVSEALILDDNLDQGPVRCVATNTFGEDSETVQLYVGEAVAPTLSLSSPSETGGSTLVSFSLRVLSSVCLQSDVSGAAVNMIIYMILKYVK